MKFISTSSRSMLTKFINHALNQTLLQYYNVSPKIVPLLKVLLHASWPTVSLNSSVCPKLALIALPLSRIIQISVQMLDSARSLQTLSHCFTGAVMDWCWLPRLQCKINNLSITLINGLSLDQLFMQKQREFRLVALIYQRAYHYLTQGSTLTLLASRDMNSIPYWIIWTAKKMDSHKLCLETSILDQMGPVLTLNTVTTMIWYPSKDGITKM